MQTRRLIDWQRQMSSHFFPLIYCHRVDRVSKKSNDPACDDAVGVPSLSLPPFQFIPKDNV